MFSEHGTYDVKLINNVLVVECHGAWNGENAIAYGKEASMLLKEVFGRPWAQITVITDWELATPDVDSIMAELVSKANKLGLCREAVVNASGAGSVKLEQFNRTLADIDNDFIRKVFTNFEDAACWLSNEGFPVD